MTEANDDLLWTAKLAARLHDPAEKALMSLRPSRTQWMKTSWPITS